MVNLNYTLCATGLTGALITLQSQMLLMIPVATPVFVAAAKPFWIAYSRKYFSSPFNMTLWTAKVVGLDNARASFVNLSAGRAGNRNALILDMQTSLWAVLNLTFTFTILATIKVFKPAKSLLLAHNQDAANIAWHRLPCGSRFIAASKRTVFLFWMLVNFKCGFTEWTDSRFHVNIIARKGVRVK